MGKHTFFSNEFKLHQFWDAISKRDLKTVELLLDEISDVDTKKNLVNSMFAKTEQTILGFIATESEFPDDERTQQLVKLLMEAGADPATRDRGEHNTHLFCNTALLNAIAAEKWNLVLFLINQYDRKQHQNYINMASVSANAKNTPLIFAFKKQVAPIEVISALLEKGANPDLQNHYLETPLHYAAYYADDALLNLLLKYKADPAKPNYWGITPFDIYAEHFSKKDSDIPKATGKIVAEENDLPVFYYENYGGHTESVANFSVMRDHVEFLIWENEFSKIRFNIHPNFRPITFMVELVHPHTKPDWMDRKNPNQEMKNKLKPDGYDEEALHRRMKEINVKHEQQKALIEKGEYVLHSETPTINQLLDLLNQYIIKTKPTIQLIKLRLKIAMCNSIYTAEKIFSNQEYDSIDKEFKKMFKERCDAIYQTRLDQLNVELNASDIPEWREMARLMQEDQTASAAERVAFIVKKLLQESDKRQIVDKIFEKVGIDEKEQQTIQAIEVDLKPAMQKRFS